MLVALAPATLRSLLAWTARPDDLPIVLLLGCCVAAAILGPLARRRGDAPTSQGPGAEGSPRDLSGAPTSRDPGT